MEHQRRWWAVTTLGMATFIASIDLNIVTLALPQMGKSFHQPDTAMPLVVLTYSAAMVLLLLPAGYWITRLRPWLTEVIAVLGFAAASVLCGLAPNFPVLLIGRALQGVFAAFITTMGVALAAVVVSPSERGKAMGILSAVSTLGSVAGSGLGGFVVNFWGWPGIFFVNLPVAFLAILLALWSLRGTTFTERETGSYSQAILTMLRQSQMIFVLLCLCGLSLVAGAIYFLLPFDLTQIQHFPASVEGLILLCIPVGMVVMALVGGYLTDRYGARPVMFAGVVIVLAGVIMQLLVLGHPTSPLDVSWRLLVTGGGIGLFAGPVQTLIVSLSSKRSLGIASALSALIRYAGFAIGPLLVSVVWLLMTPGASQMTGGMAAIGVFTFLCLGLTWLATRSSSLTESPEEAASPVPSR